jgi:hypothetical protein
MSLILGLLILMVGCDETEKPVEPTIPLVTLEELKQNPSEYDGQQIRLIAMPVVFTLSCVGGFCRPWPCCQDCVGLFGICDSTDAIMQLYDSDKTAWTCDGSYCGWEESCYPFSTAYDSLECLLVGVVEDHTVFEDKPWFRMYVDYYEVVNDN